MGILKPTFAIIQDTRKPTSATNYPLKLRVTFNRQSRLYGIGFDLTQEQFGKLFSTKLRDEYLKEIRLICEVIKDKASKMTQAEDNFSFDKFKNEFFSKPQEEANTKDVYKQLEAYVSQLKAEDRASTASSYQSTLNSLKAFQKKLTFENITPDFLRKYEKWMLLKNNSSTTVGIYLRSLRTIYNQAIEKGIITRENYPFTKKKFQIPAGQNIKKALTITEIGQIFKYPTIPLSSEDKAKDFWIFSYLCNGLNIKDICQIKWKDIDGDKLTVIRAKTANTTKSNQKPISIMLNDMALQIIEKWGTDKALGGYVFPILQEGITATRERELVQYFTKFINKYMKRIGEQLGVDKNLTTYVARHSFSTVLKRSGVSTEYISEALGHQNLKTTESYLGSFEDTIKKQFSNLLTKFD